MKIGVYYNAEQVEREVAVGLAERIQSSGCGAVLFSDVNEVKGVDRLIVLGGDGTMLRAAKRTSELGIPLVGVNFGRLGFLTEFERDGAEDAVSLAVNGGEIAVRSMLEVNLNGVTTHCLNECAVLHGVSPEHANRVARFSVAIDGSGAGEFHGDGLIVCTPTGSTAYSLSAGGSILTPDCSAFLLTPVCAFSMRSRPIVFPDSSTLTISLVDRNLLLYGDGVFLGEVKAEDVLTVKRSPRTARFLTRSKAEYFRRLTEKIN